MELPTIRSILLALLAASLLVASSTPAHADPSVLDGTWVARSHDSPLTYLKISQGNLHTEWRWTVNGRDSVVTVETPIVTRPGSNLGATALSFAGAGPCSLRVEGDQLFLRYPNELDGAVPRQIVFRREGERAAPGGDDMPPFPWPPLKPTARMALPDSLVTRSPSETLGTFFDRIKAALLRGGFSQPTLYGIPNHRGFVVVTRLENIDLDGKPLAPRFSVEEPPPNRPRSFGEFLKALVFAPKGRYRIIVLAVTDSLVVPTTKEPTEKQAIGWLSDGFQIMPARVRSMRLGPDAHCEALVYEFERSDKRDEEGRIRASSTITAAAHVSLSGMWTREELGP